MRKSKIFFGSLALLSMGLYSCSSDEPVVGGGNQTIDGDRYMAVNISTAGLGATRVAGEGFEEGKAKEGSISTENTRFYFFDASGNAFTMESAVNVNGDFVVSNMVKPLEISSVKDDGNSNVAESNSVLVLGKAVGSGFQGVVPAQAVCIVGLSDTDFTKLQNKSLSTLAKTVKEYEGESFIMSNSNWQGAGDNGAVSIADKIQTTPELAKENPAEFYMERLAVKVRLKEGSLGTFVSKAADGSSDATYDIYDENGAKQSIKLQVKLDGWQLIKKGNGSYLIKQLPEYAFDDWNAPTYHRSYWATTPATAETEAKTYDIYTQNGWKTGVGDENAEYTNEWTKVGQDNNATKFTRDLETTAVVIRGHVQKVPAAGGEATNLDLVRWSGTYFELNSFKNMVIKAYNKEKGTTLGVSAVTLVEDTGNDNVYKVYVDNQVDNQEYPTYSKVQYWIEGATSFYVNITNGKGWFGVVRNHIYEYELEAVVGLGIPGNDPGKPQETETFVAANLIELNWKVVSNKLTLE